MVRNASGPAVSVVIPVYNGENYLDQCLASVLNQTFNDYEVIAVNNNSTDGSSDIIKRWQRRDPRLRCVFESRRSRGAARNAGVRFAQGQIIAMTDADCRVPPDWISALCCPILKEGENFVMGFERDMIRNKWTAMIQDANEFFLKANGAGKYISVLDTKNFAARADVLRQFLFDDDIGNLEDFELSLRLKGRHRIRFLPDVRVAHRHKRTIVSWALLCINRGYWARRIFEKHKMNAAILEEPMFESLRAGNQLVWPFWLVIQLFKNPFQKFLFQFLSEVSWRAGLLFGCLKTN